MHAQNGIARAPDAKGARFDVCVKDSTRVFDREIQTVRESTVRYLRDFTVLCMITHMPARERKPFLLIAAVLSFCTIVASLIVVLHTVGPVPSTYSVSADALVLSPVPASAENAALLAEGRTTRRYGGKTAVVLGYGCNDEQTVSVISQTLTGRYGSAVEIFVYPDDFLRSGVGRISMLSSLMESYAPTGLIIVGAPEYTHAVLARMQDAGVSYPIVCLFPQDDVLGIEAGSDLVLEYMPVAETTETDSELSAARAADALPELLMHAVRYMSLRTDPLERDENLIMHARALAGNGWSVKQYTDPETGLTSLNHFIIEQQN